MQAAQHQQGALYRKIIRIKRFSLCQTGIGVDRIIRELGFVEQLRLVHMIGHSLAPLF
ncbi:hypothetical protein SDC9_179051 [bioreactor metagenome]|uniref:Uncharacterized protein n=1 Tax=bioreactor metagenome TaxID=1076179 RepID=A0A645GXW4_9ZZZZ